MKIYGVVFFCCMYFFLDCSFKKSLSWEVIDSIEFYPDDEVVSFFKKTVDEIELIKKNQENLKDIALSVSVHKDKKSIQKFVEKFKNQKNNWKKMSIKAFSDQIAFEKQKLKFFEENSFHERLGSDTLLVNDFATSILEEYDKICNDTGIVGQAWSSLFDLYKQGNKCDNIEVSTALDIFLEKSRKTVFADLQYMVTLQQKEEYLIFLGQAFKL